MRMDYAARVLLERLKYGIDDTGWYEPINNTFNPAGGLPVGPAVGDSYISLATANGWTNSFIYSWDGRNWVQTPTAIGNHVYNLNDGKVYQKIGAAVWAAMDTTLDHTLLLNIGTNSHAAIDLFALDNLPAVPAADIDANAQDIINVPNVNSPAAATITVTGATGANVTATTGNAAIGATAGQSNITGQTGANVEATTGNVGINAVVGNANIEGDVNVDIEATTGNVVIHADAMNVDIDADQIVDIEANAGNVEIDSVGGNIEITSQAQVVTIDGFTQVNLNVAGNPAIVTNAVTVDVNAQTITNIADGTTNTGVLSKLQSDQKQVSCVLVDGNNVGIGYFAFNTGTDHYMLIQFRIPATWNITRDIRIYFDVSWVANEGTPRDFQFGYKAVGAGESHAGAYVEAALTIAAANQDLSIKVYGTVPTAALAAGDLVMVRLRRNSVAGNNLRCYGFNVEVQ